MLKEKHEQLLETSHTQTPSTNENVLTKLKKLLANPMPLFSLYSKIDKDMIKYLLIRVAQLEDAELDAQAAYLFATVQIPDPSEFSCSSGMAEAEEE